MKNEKISKIVALLQSRKFWAAFIGIIFMFLNELLPEFPLEEDQVANMIYLLIAYIAGVAIEDAGFGIGGGQVKK